MTAIVGTINRRGVAFAADSAATHTVSSKHKITNHANKIFELSRRHPVGVCICGNLDFLGMPWEDIFKLFRKELGKTSCANLKEYPTMFFEFVKTHIMSHLLEDQTTNLRVIVNGFWQEIIDISSKELKEASKDTSEENLFCKIQEKLIYFENIYSPININKCADFEDYTIEEFTSYAMEIIEDVLKEPLNSHLCPKDFLKQFTQALYNIIVSTVHVYLVNSEIIFWGYGEEDLFPSYFSFIISSAFDGRIKFTNKSAYVVSNINDACVEPFAQTDVANTVVRGIDDDLRKKFYDSYKASITVFRDEIISQLDSAGAPEVLKDALLKIDLENYTNLYVQGMDLYIQDNYIAKLVNTVSYLSKEDLADMAESLVRMTYLKRRITSEEESVGGPVDVAVITKGDGFVWLKRKHYFSAELNPHYFERTNID